MRSGNMLVDRMDDDMNKKDRDYCFDCGYAPCRCEELRKERQEELEALCPTFEMFLIDRHADQYVGLDDEMPDDCSGWMGNLEFDNIMKYAEEYGKECFRAGQRIGK